MSNYHSDEWIMNRVNEHYNDALNLFDEDKIVGIFNQGSANYGLDVETSDVDTKLIVTPSFMDIALNIPAISHTHVRTNEEHIDCKDVRNYIQLFRKQNPQFLEVLFTPYKIINPIYQEYWDMLVREREAIAHYCRYDAVKAMKGMAMEKYHAMEHKYPSKVAIIERYGYDAKQLSHIRRLQDMISRYIAGEPFEDCLKPKDIDFILKIKRNEYNLDTARMLANSMMSSITSLADEFCNKIGKAQNTIISEFLYEVQYNIMKETVKREI